MVYQANKSDIGLRLKEALARAGVKNTELAELTGVTVQAVGAWTRTGRISRMHLHTICDRLGISVEWLLTGREPNNTHHRPPAGLTYIREKRQVPIISSVQAGRPREAVDSYMVGGGADSIGLDADFADHVGKYAFALVVDGESMLPDFRPGDIVLIDPDATVRPGDIVVAKMDADESVTLKKYRSRGNDAAGQPIFELVPLNDDYPTLMVNSANPGQIIGPVIEHRRRMR